MEPKYPVLWTNIVKVHSNGIEPNCMGRILQCIDSHYHVVVYLDTVNETGKGNVYSPLLHLKLLVLV